MNPTPAPSCLLKLCATFCPQKLSDGQLKVFVPRSAFWVTIGSGDISCIGKRISFYWKHSISGTVGISDSFANAQECHCNRRLLNCVIRGLAVALQRRRMPGWRYRKIETNEVNRFSLSPSEGLINGTAKAMWGGMYIWRQQKFCTCPLTGKNVSLHWGATCISRARCARSHLKDFIP